VTDPRRGLAGRLAARSVSSRLTPLGVLAAIGLGLVSVLTTPREEEPQIIVPMVDVFVPLPGATPGEVEAEVTTGLERRLWGIPGVEYVYSTSARDGALLTARFRVNEPLEPSLVKVRQEIDAHPELIPVRAGRPAVTLVSIDDVPVVTVTLRGSALAPGVLRQLGQEVARELATIPEAAQVQVLGGARRVLRVEPDPRRLRELDLSLGEIRQAVQSTDAEAPAGSLVDRNRRVELSASTAVGSAEDLRRLVVARRGGRPILLGDVAQVTDGPERDPAVVLGASRTRPEFEQAVSVDVAKRRGANATVLADQVKTRLAALRGGLLPSGVEVELTRNSGETARERSDELIRHLLIATLSVVTLVGFAMGWRSAVVVAIAVPVTLSLTLLINQLLGNTLNRITLFALIFSIGILVDDAIVVVENVHRHLLQPGRKQGLVRTVLDAVDEVGNPTILATFAVIAAILPMGFVRGLMGPYMRPIPVGGSLAMLFSLAVAFVVAPWAALRLLGHERGRAPDETRETWSTRTYRRIIRTLLRSGRARLGFLALVLALFAGAVALVGVGFVRVKMLPFDNKSEFQVFVDLPGGATREQSLAVGQQLGRVVLADPDVLGVQVHSLTPAPMTFVGMVRHTFLRGSPEQVDLTVQLVGKHARKRSSHEIATVLRPKLTAITAPLGARLRLVEIPPGPPVLATLVAEIYGPGAIARDGYAAQVRDAFRGTAGVVDVDSSLEAVTPRTELRVDRERAALQGVNPAAVVEALALTQPGTELGTVRVERGTTRVPIVLGLSPVNRAGLADLLQIPVQGERGAVPLETLVRPVEESGAPRFHKNLMPVSYVLAELSGSEESPVYALMALNRKLDALRPHGEPVPRYGLSMPPDTERLAMKWDGEWHITLEVFRDLGLAFAAVLVLIYLLVVGWFDSFVVPWVVLLPIPLSLIGILPAHGLLGAFFTATSMIGFIAGAGIIVRNSIILVDFIRLKTAEGMPLEAAVEEAGVVRFRPMLLTAAAVVVGSAVMLADPIFQGLAISMMAGEVAATLLSRIAVPVLYTVLARRFTLGPAAPVAVLEPPPVPPAHGTLTAKPL
jgi:multidrug efflux pump subunit AcrB